MAQNYLRSAVPVQFLRGWALFRGVIEVSLCGRYAELIKGQTVQHLRFSRATKDHQTCLRYLAIGHAAREACAVLEVDLDLGTIRRIAKDSERLDRLPNYLGTFNRLLT